MFYLWKRSEKNWERVRSFAQKVIGSKLTNSCVMSDIEHAGTEISVTLGSLHEILPTSRFSKKQDSNVSHKSN